MRTEENPRTIWWSRNDDPTSWKPGGRRIWCPRWLRALVKALLVLAVLAVPAVAAQAPPVNSLTLEGVVDTAPRNYLPTLDFGSTLLLTVPDPTNGQLSTHEILCPIRYDRPAETVRCDQFRPGDRVRVSGWIVSLHLGAEYRAFVVARKVKKIRG